MIILHVGVQWTTNYREIRLHVHVCLTDITYSLFIIYNINILVDEVVCPLCGNGGTCSAYGRDLSCSCAAGFTGDTCTEGKEYQY